MARKSSKSTAMVTGTVLYTDSDGIDLGSDAWQVWLEAGNTFYFDDERFGSFTARAEKRRNGLSWYAFKKVDGKLHKHYLGRKAGLTLARLREVATLFTK